LAADLEAAHWDYVRASALAPNQPDGWRGAAQTAHALNDLGQARQYYSRVLQLSPGDSAAYLCRGLLNLQTGDRRAALNDFQQASGSARVSNDRHRRLALALAHATAGLGVDTTPIPDVDGLVATLNCPLPDMLNDMAVCWLYAALGELDQALVGAQRLMHAWPDMQPHGLVMMWWFQTALGRAADAQDTYRHLHTDLDNRGWHLHDFLRYGLHDWPLNFPVILPSATPALVALLREPDHEATP
jgi:tetratricopeptide (TPR) repeat protein